MTKGGIIGSITRRQIILTTPAALLAQPAQPPQAPAAAPQGADAELNASREQQRHYAEELAKVPLTMTTEPAFHFKP